MASAVGLGEVYKAMVGAYMGIMECRLANAAEAVFSESNAAMNWSICAWAAPTRGVTTRVMMDVKASRTDLRASIRVSNASTI